MAFEFIDEVETQTPQSPSGVGFEFIDEQPQGGVEFLGETRPPPDDEIISKVGNPTYKPSLEEFKLYRDAKERRPFSLSRFAGTAIDAAGTALRDIGALGKEVVTLEQWRHPLNTAQSVLEGAARNIYDTGLLARKFNPTPNPAGGSFYSEEQYVQYKLTRTNQEAFPQGGATQAIKLQDVPQETLAQWKTEYKDLQTKTDYDRFIQEWEYQQPRIQATQGSQPLAPEVIGNVNPKIAEGMSYIADPTAIIPGGIATKGAGLTERALAATALKGGKAVSTVAGGIADVNKAAAKKVEEAIVVATGTTPEAIRAGAASVGAGSLLTPIAPVTAKVAVVYGGLRTVEKAGEVAQAVGRALPKANERFGLFANIAKDADSPAWLRASAGRLKKLDPAVATAGAITKGGAQGAAIGATIGGITEGEEGASAGLGSGGVLGAGGAAAGRLLSAGSRLEDAKQATRDSWISTKTPEEIDLIKRSGLTEDEALKIADLEFIMKGITGKDTPGDVAFVPLKADDFKARAGTDAKGAHLVEGDRPTVYINAGYKGPNSWFHEAMHALDSFNEFTPQRVALDKLLFDQVTSDGAIISKGLYSVDDMAQFGEQYRNKLTDDGRAEFDLMTPDQKQKYMMAEMRADHFTNLLKGSQSETLSGVSSLKTKILDSMLLAEDNSMLGKMRGVLEKAGVKFDQSGAPSELFIKDGKPLTNTPEINAALRDYLRAKDGITKRLIASDDETPSFTITREDLAKGNRAAVEAMKGSDIFARNPDGSIKTVGGNPEKIKALETKVGQLEADARAASNSAAESQKKSADAELLARKADDARIEAEKALQTAQSKVQQAQLKAEILKAREARRAAQAFLKEAKAAEKQAKAQIEATEAARKELAAEEKLSGPTYVLLSEGEIKKLQAKRVEAIMDALKKIPDKGEAGAVKIDPEEKELTLAGKHLSDEQMAALKALSDDTLAPVIKERIEAINNQLKNDDGTQLFINYNAALKGKSYSSAIPATDRMMVPLSIKITKAGNFVVTTLDTSHFYRKLQDWRKSKPKVFEPWQGDVDLFIRDTFKYLDNHANELPGKTGLATDDKTATLKRDTINDFFNVPGHQDVNPIQASTKSEKDNLIRARRLDRINRIQESEGDKFPIDYGLQKKNYLPMGDNKADALKAIEKNGLFDLDGKAIDLNPDGTVTLYHRTTPKQAAEIRKTGKFYSRENTKEVFLSNRQNGHASNYGDEIVAVKIHPEDIRIDDAFGDEIHVAVKASSISKQNFLPASDESPSP